MRVLLSTVVSIALLSACTTTTATSRTEAKEQVTAASDSWQIAYNSRYPSRITALYDSTAVLWGTTAKVIAADPSAIADYFKDAGKRPNTRVTFGKQHLRVYDDVAVNTGYYTFSDNRDGKEVSNPARYNIVFRKQNGQWLIVAHHSSRMP